MADVTDFEVCRKIIEKLMDISLAHRNALLAKKIINSDEYLQLGQTIEEPLFRKHQEYTLRIFEGTIKLLTPYMEKIKSVTQELDKVLDKLEKFNETINFLSKIVNFFGGILSAASKGVAGVPKIFSGLEEIMSL